MGGNSMTRFPNESAEYRAKRDELLAAEQELRRHVERVAELRRKLPLGGAVKEDYVFDDGAAPVKLSELFREGFDTLGVYNFMYGPQMAQPCPMCTSFLDSLDGAVPHATKRMNLAVVAKSPIERIRDFARGRGWRNLPLLSSGGNTYNRDYFGENAKGQQPAFNVFVRRDGKIYHFYNTELAFGPGEPGQDPRHIDMMWPLWNLLDFTPEGRGADWYPRLSY